MTLTAAAASTQQRGHAPLLVPCLASRWPVNTLQAINSPSEDPIASAMAISIKRWPTAVQLTLGICELPANARNQPSTPEVTLSRRPAEENQTAGC